MPLKFRLRLFLSFCILVIAAHANADPLRLTPVAGHLPDLHFTLRSSKAKTVTELDYRGKVVLLYFGFAGCTSECPTTLGRMAALPSHVKNSLHKIRFLFVSVDPAHDTPAALEHYLSAYDANFVSGLTGAPDAVAALARRYRAAWRPYRKSGEPVMHSNLVYLFDSHGRTRAIITPNNTDEAIAHDLALLVAERD